MTAGDGGSSGDTPPGPGQADDPRVDTPTTVNSVTFEEPVSTDELGVKIVPQSKDRLRQLTVTGMFTLIITSLLAILAGLGFHWFDGEFAKTIIQSVISPILGALAAIIGYLFAERQGDSGR